MTNNINCREGIKIFNMEEPTILSIEEFRKMTGEHDISDEEVQEKIDSIARLAEILIGHLKDKGEI